MCPSCGIELVASGTRLHCKQCNGMLVRPEEVEEMMRHMAPDQPRTLSKLILAGGTDAPRKCPSCDVMMTVCLLAGVTVDQCPTHGIWFDGKELTRALEGQGSPVKSPTLSTLYGWWQAGKRS
jgi:Zn-finger nucleic acid-binding protein